jgi:hypothetical protein
MTTLAPLYIDGVALWTSALPGWAMAAPAFRGQTAGAPVASPARPSPALLAANERRRAPDAVLLALEVAAAACQTSGHQAADLASVFTSAHGDLPTTDAMCRTLAADPLLLSPTRFHHSVHNAASGYWAMASGSHAPSTALSAHANSFAMGWLEAASQCLSTGAPVLLVGYDTSAVGPLASVNPSCGLLAVALVLSPKASPSTSCKALCALQPGGARATPLRSAAAQLLAHNAMADALPLFEALACLPQPARVLLPLGPGQGPQAAMPPPPKGDEQSNQVTFAHEAGLHLQIDLSPAAGLAAAA